MSLQRSFYVDVQYSFSGFCLLSLTIAKIVTLPAVLLFLHSLSLAREVLFTDFYSALFGLKLFHVASV